MNPKINIHTIIRSILTTSCYRVSAMTKDAITDAELTTVDITESLYPLC